MIPSRAIKTLLLIIVWVASFSLHAQQGGIKWSKDGTAYYRVEQNEIVQYTLPANEKKVFVGKQQLTPAGQTAPLRVNLYAFSDDQKKTIAFNSNLPYILNLYLYNCLMILYNYNNIVLEFKLFLRSLS